MARSTVAQLEFDPAYNPTKDGEEVILREALSAVLQVGNSLWVANDETLSLERFSLQGYSTDGIVHYNNHAQFLLADYLRLPEPPTDPEDFQEADIEGLAYHEGHLWLVGSHSRKRTKPKKGLPPSENQKRLEKVKTDSNRFLLARIPMIEENGTLTLKKSGTHNGKKLVAAQLGGDKDGNDLLSALEEDGHFQRFLSIPGKENGFDIEGIVAVDDRLFIGLRGPVLRGHATILEVELEEDNKDSSVLKLKNIGPDKQPYRKHILDLGDLGTRDLCVQGSDLLILAGPTMGLDGPVMIFRWHGGARPGEESFVRREELQTVMEVPYGLGENKGKDHAEGMTLFTTNNGQNAILIVYDSAGDHRLKENNIVEADIFQL
ncbi:MAG TPA: DUF3616 domain-containing protein [Ardenticatenaceae bacterium]|jgi:hypothetical protein